MATSSKLLVALGVLAVVVLVWWSVSAQLRRRRERRAALDRLGFAPCPDRREWLEKTVAAVENKAAWRYEVRDPMRLPGPEAVYYYVKRRQRPGDEEPIVEEEVLFRLSKPVPGGLALIVKPTSMPPGLATRLLGAVATGPWDAQPDDLQRLELPADLRDTNLLGALGPAGARLHDLAGADVLSVAMGLGDAGGMWVRLRGEWCVVAGGSARIPFRVDEIVARIRALL